MGASRSKQGLSQEDLEFLKVHTRYDENTIKEWYKGFEQDCPNGHLNPAKFVKMYKMFFPSGNADQFCDNVFRTFDTDKNGYIDFKEFLLAIEATSAGTADEKLKWAFRMYDVDGNGKINQEEMTKIMQAIYDMLGASAMRPTDSAKERAKNIFSRMDRNGDGHLTEVEFWSGCLQDEVLFEMLGLGFLSGPYFGFGVSAKNLCNKSKQGLTWEDLEFLKAHTRYDENTIKEWYKVFKQACPNGQLTSKKFVDMYKMFFQSGNPEEFCDNIFRTLDTDKNGYIDFEEFLLAIKATSTSTTKEKLKWAFRMYDMDSNGMINQEEMTKIVQAIYDILGTGTTWPMDSAEEMAKIIFSRMDRNGDGHLTEDEFLSGCMQDKRLSKVLGFGFLGGGDFGFGVLAKNLFRLPTTYD